MDYKIKAPQVLKAKVMLWTDVSYHDMEVIEKMLSIPDLENALCSVFRIDLPEPKRQVLLELYVQTVLFSRELSLKKEQTSALLSIIKSIHEANIETPFNNIEQCLTYYKELLLCHSVRRPPFSINLFSCEQVDCILKYIYDNYLRHYKLYKYIFTPQVKLDLSLTYSGTADHGSAISLSGDENAMEGDTVPKETMPLETKKTSISDSSATSSASISDLKTLIEQEVRQQMKLISGQLDQTVREGVFQRNNQLILHNHKAKNEKTNRL